MKKVFLLPGQMHVAKEPTEIATVLGSCVAVVLWDIRTKILGVNHYLLAKQPQNEAASCRYGDFAIKSLFDEMLEAGASPKTLKAKIFGGAQLFSGISDFHKVGQKNIEIAESLLSQNGIPIVERVVGGPDGRKIFADSNTFDVKVVIARSDSSKSESDVDVTGFGRLRIASQVSVLVVDDSATVRSIFTNLFKKQGLNVVGAASSAFEAREMIVKLKPDVITLDIEMPGMSGVKFLEKLIEHHPMPVIMVSSLSSKGDAAIRALEVGAIDFIEKPTQTDPAALRDLAATVCEKVRAAASVDINRLVESRKKGMLKPTGTVIESKSSLKSKAGVLDVIVITGNTGSFEALKEVVSKLGSDMPPVVIANSSLATFTNSFIDALKAKGTNRVYVATNGMSISSGNVYIAKAAEHLEVDRVDGRLVLKSKPGSPVANQIPSANVLLTSISKSAPKSSIAILLGGFGQDGVDGAAQLSKVGGVVMAQDPAECLFPHVPQRAIQLGIPDVVAGAQDLVKEVWKWRSKIAS